MKLKPNYIFILNCIDTYKIFFMINYYVSFLHET